MRTTGFVFLASILALTACEHENAKNKNKDRGVGSAPQATPPAGGGGAMGNPLPADQRPPAPPPAEAPKAATDPNVVGAPVAADLEGFLKPVTGDGKLVATFETSQGTIHCELFPEQAPMTVANFVGLATGQKAWKNPKTGTDEKGKPYFDGLTFHRVIPEFMIQGGDPTGTGRSGPGYNFGDEFVSSLRMQPGTLAMANAGPSTNGSQFFITEGAPEHLNGKHTIFGQCKELDIVKQIARVPQNGQNKPDVDVTVNKVSISRMKSW